MTAKQEKFCREYLLDLNATQAAIRAGYSKKTAVEQGCRLLINVNISKRIQASQKKQQEKTEITLDKILKEYSKIAFFDITKNISDGKLKELAEWDADSAGAIAGLEVEEQVKDKFVLQRTKKIKLCDKRAALDSLCKVLGFNAPEKSEIKMDRPPLDDEQVNKLLNAIKRTAK